MSITRSVSALVAALVVGFAGGAWLTGGNGEPGPPLAPDTGGQGDRASTITGPGATPCTAVAGESAPAPGAGDADAATEVVAGAAVSPTLTLSDIEALLGALPADERDTWLADASALGRLVEEESALRSVLAAAEVSRALDDPLTALLVQRARDRTLVDLYLARVVRANLHPDWPADADISKRLAEQPERFRLPERVPTWQIFLPLATGASEAAATALATRGRELAALLQKGKADFAVVAEEHSGHAASRAAGGYMGLLAVPDLLPEMRELLGKLPPGDVSLPVRSAEGFHIVRFGARQPARDLPVTEARMLARQVLLREAAAAIREAALDKIRETHPVRVAEADRDAWHLALLSRDWTGSAAAADENARTDPSAAPPATGSDALPEPSAALARPAAN